MLISPYIIYEFDINITSHENHAKNNSCKYQAMIFE